MGWVGGALLGGALVGTLEGGGGGGGDEPPALTVTVELPELWYPSVAMIW